MLIQIYLASDITLSSQTDLINCFIDKFSLVHITKNIRTCYANEVRWNISIFVVVENMSNVSKILILVLHIRTAFHCQNRSCCIFFYIYKKLHCLFYITKWNYENLFSNCKYAFEWLFLILKTQKVRGKYPHGVSKIRHAKYCYSTHKGTNTFWEHTAKLSKYKERFFVDMIWKIDVKQECV